jgi:phosphomannomutase
MEEIKNTALRGIFETKDIHGRVVTGEYLDAYVLYLLGRASGKVIKHFKVVFDLGNGMTALVLPHILEKLPIDAVLLCKEMDLTFPNHEANPIKDETLAMLRESIEIEHADFGVAFDGDGDRVSFTTAQGRLVPSDYILALLAEAKLREDPHPKIVFDLRTSKSVREYLENIGAIGIESRVGRSFIKDSMRTHDALLGGELSGHYFFKDFFYSDSALIAFLEVLVFLSSTQKTLDELVAPLDRYVSSGEINIKVADKERIFDTIAAAYHDATRVSYLDGISIEYPSFWFNVRASNTEPLLRVIMEAKNAEMLSTKLGELRILLEKSISLS